MRVIKTRRMRWAELIGRMRDRRGAYRILMGRTDGKRPFGRPRLRWDDSIKISLQDVGWEGMDLIDLTQDRTGGGRL
jgi:hypothetical protein